MVVPRPSPQLLKDAIDTLIRVAPQVVTPELHSLIADAQASYSPSAVRRLQVRLEELAGQPIKSSTELGSEPIKKYPLPTLLLQKVRDECWRLNSTSVPEICLSAKGEKETILGPCTRLEFSRNTMNATGSAEVTFRSGQPQLIEVADRKTVLISVSSQDLPLEVMSTSDVPIWIDSL